MRTSSLISRLCALFILVVLAQQSLFAQSFRAGQYYGGNETLSTVLSLYEDGSFFLTVSNGSSGVAGRGVWEAESDSLYLTFSVPFHFELGHWELREETLADRTKVIVNVHDAVSREPIPGAQVTLVPSVDIGAIADVFGKAVLLIPNGVEAEYVEARFIAHTAVEIPFSVVAERESVVDVFISPTTHEYYVECSHCSIGSNKKPHRIGFAFEDYRNSRFRLSNDLLVIDLVKRH